MHGLNKKGILDVALSLLPILCLTKLPGDIGL
jgi:hypothetical protein